MLSVGFRHRINLSSRLAHEYSPENTTTQSDLPPGSYLQCEEEERNNVLERRDRILRKNVTKSQKSKHSPSPVVSALLSSNFESSSPPLGIITISPAFNHSSRTSLPFSFGAIHALPSLAITSLSSVLNISPFSRVSNIVATITAAERNLHDGAGVGGQSQRSHQGPMSHFLRCIIVTEFFLSQVYLHYSIPFLSYTRQSMPESPSLCFQTRSEASLYHRQNCSLVYGYAGAIRLLLLLNSGLD
jgi:hypothetical protein